MAPKQGTSAQRTSTSSRGSSGAARGRGRPRAAERAESSPSHGAEVEQVEDEREEENQQKTIPAELLTRLLHEFFESESTRITKDANGAVAKYMDIFVREAIARAAAEREAGFLEVRLLRCWVIR